MPTYEFACLACRQTFSLVMRISERAAATVRCPGCGSDRVEAVLQPFHAKTTRKS